MPAYVTLPTSKHPARLRPVYGMVSDDDLAVWAIVPDDDGILQTENVRDCKAVRELVEYCETCTLPFRALDLALDDETGAARCYECAEHPAPSACQHTGTWRYDPGVEQHVCSDCGGLVEQRQSRAEPLPPRCQHEDQFTDPAGNWRCRCGAVVSRPVRRCTFAQLPRYKQLLVLAAWAHLDRDEAVWYTRSREDARVAALNALEDFICLRSEQHAAAQP